MPELLHTPAPRWEVRGGGPHDGKRCEPTHVTEVPRVDGQWGAIGASDPASRLQIVRVYGRTIAARALAGDFAGCGHLYHLVEIDGAPVWLYLGCFPEAPAA